jgi:putative Mg2+ transporter-C (MgtC) family protein
LFGGWTEKTFKTLPGAPRPLSGHAASNHCFAKAISRGFAFKGHLGRRWKILFLDRAKVHPVRMGWFTSNWLHVFPSPWNYVVLVLAAVTGGALVGAERERKAKAVGIRTLALVSLGSAVFTLISTVLGEKNAEALRVAPQIVSGIGFLGAGVIIRGQFGITGLTSAATIWAVAAAGMTIGTGYGGAGLVLSLLILCLLWLLSNVEQRYIGPCQFEWARLRYRAAGGKTGVKIHELLDEYRIPECCRVVPSGELAETDSKHETLRLCYCRMHRHHREFLARLAEMDEVEEIRHEGVLQAKPPRTVRRPRRV